MKILVIPDIHGSWKNTLSYIKEHKDSVDRVITLGDYVDAWDEEDNGEPMINGFTELASMAKSEPNKFVILIGNHDLSYLAKTRNGSSCSGHHWQYAERYNDMFRKNFEFIHACYMVNGILFSHAGVGKSWWENTLIKEYNYRHQYDTIPELKDKLSKLEADSHNIVNKYFDGKAFSLVNPEGEDVEKAKRYYEIQEDLHKQINELYFEMRDKAILKIEDKSFDAELLDSIFAEEPEALNHCSWSSSGDMIGESCVWIRPEALITDEWDSSIKLQVVGHTELGLGKYEYKGRKLIVCDNKEHDCFFTLNTDTILNEEYIQLHEQD